MQARLCDRCKDIIPKDHKALIVTVVKEHQAVRQYSLVGLGSASPSLDSSRYSSTKELCEVCSEQFRTLYGAWLGEADDVRQIV